MVRTMRPEELPVVTDIATRAFRGIYDALEDIYGREVFAAVVPDKRTAKIEQLTAHSRSFPDWIFVCEEGGVVVGVITFSLDPRSKIGVIGNNAVDPACGLKGIGQQMYKAVLAYFKERGMQFAEVTTGLDPSHDAARRAYERAGFDVKVEKVTYYRSLKDV